MMDLFAADPAITRTYHFKNSIKLHFLIYYHCALFARSGRDRKRKKCIDGHGGGEIIFNKDREPRLGIPRKSFIVCARTGKMRIAFAPVSPRKAITNNCRYVFDKCGKAKLNLQQIASIKARYISWFSLTKQWKEISGPRS